MCAFNNKRQLIVQRHHNRFTLRKGFIYGKGKNGPGLFPNGAQWHVDMGISLLMWLKYVFD
jgi:hypothetical protein